jgi:predicted amidohydrolase YtcJ
VRIVGVKAYADGSLLSETAYMLEGYGKEGGRGIPVSEPAYFDGLIRRAAELRLPITVHAIGDAANRMILDAVEKSGAETVYPYRIEHAQHLTPEDLPRFARLGGTASVQPIHLSFDLDQVDRARGDRAPGAYRLRSLLDSGAKLVFGSDIPVADPNPWLGVQAAVNRTRFDGLTRARRQRSLGTVTCWARSRPGSSRTCASWTAIPSLFRGKSWARSVRS